MTPERLRPDVRPTLAERFGALSTSVKTFALLSLALLPLGFIALLASLQSSRTADLQRRADLRVAVTEGTRNLGAELASDVSALSSAANAIDIGAPSDQICARLTAILGASGRRTAFALFGPGATPLCAAGLTAVARPPRPLLDIHPEAHLAGDGIDVVVPGRAASAVAIVHYPAATLYRLARPSGFAAPITLDLITPEGPIELARRDNKLLLADQEVSAPVGILDLALEMTVDAPPFTAADALLTFLPLLMWAAAAGIGFIVVDRLLIDPLETLRRAVSAYRPGAPFNLPPIRTPAREIAELGEAVEKLGDEVAAHQSDLEASLAHQGKLIREVHHRVKNNLQVVTSLINLHARSATSPEAIEAYAAIQRRVDALAIVQRNHYSDAEDGGIACKALIGELATNLRAGLGIGEPAPPITITATDCRLTQDAAIPIALLITELAELSIKTAPAAPISIAMTSGEEESRAHLAIASAGLVAGEALNARLELGAGRVLGGLARQLRTTLDHDGAAGRYSLTLPILDGR